MQLREWQTEALNTLREHDFRGTLKVASGQGKTVLAIAALKEILTNQNDQALVVVPTINLMEQWIKEIAKFAPELTTSRYFGGKKSRKGRVIVGVINSVVDADWENIKVKVLDEIHHYGADRYQMIFDITTQHTIGLSATPEREDEGDLAIRFGTGGIVYRLNNLADLRERFTLCTIRVPFLQHEYSQYMELQAEYKRILHISNMDPGSVTRRGRRGDKMALRILKLWSQQAKLRYNAQNKLDVIRRIIHSEQDQKIIIFSESIAFAEKVAEELGAIAVHSGMSKDEVIKRLDDFRRMESAVLIAPRLIDEGYDVPNANVAIVASFSRSSRQMIQRDGRILRTKEAVRRYTLVLEGIEEDKFFSIIKRTHMDELARSGLWIRYSKGFVDDAECLHHFEEYVDEGQGYEDWMKKKLDLIQLSGKADSEFYEDHKETIHRLLEENPNNWPVMRGEEPAERIHYESEYSDQEQRALKAEVRRLHQRILLPEEFFNVLMRAIDSESFDIDEETARYIVDIAEENKLGIPDNLWKLIRSLASVMRTHVLVRNEANKS